MTNVGAGGATATGVKRPIKIGGIKAGYTAIEVACGWAEAVMKHAYSSIWAGAVMQNTPINAKNANGDQPTD